MAVSQTPCTESSPLADSKLGRLLSSSPWLAALGKLRRWPLFTWTQRLILMEALLLFWVARVLLVLLPFRTLAKWFGPVLPPSSCRTCSLSDSEAERVRRIGWAVTRIGNHTPLEGTCLPQALAASSMLLWRGLRGSLHIGVRLAGAGSPLEAHAWVHSGEVPLTGFPVAPDFQEIACIAIRQPK